MTLRSPVTDENAPSGNNKLTGETVLLLLSSLMKPLIADHLTFLAKWFVNIQAGTMFPGLSVVVWAPVLTVNSKRVLLETHLRHMFCKRFK